MQRDGRTHAHTEAQHEPRLPVNTNARREPHSRSSSAHAHKHRHRHATHTRVGNAHAHLPRKLARRRVRLEAVVRPIAERKCLAAQREPQRAAVREREHLLWLRVRVRARMCVCARVCV